MDDRSKDFGLHRLKKLSAKDPSVLPIYEHFAGIITPRMKAHHGPNPVLESRALKQTVSRIRAANHGTDSPLRDREITVAYTLAQEAKQKADKLAVEQALDARRHTVVTSIYTLAPSHRTLLAAARREKQEAVIPPAPSAVAALAAARRAAEAGWVKDESRRQRPSTVPAHVNTRAAAAKGGGSSGSLRGGRPSSRSTSPKGERDGSTSPPRSQSPPRFVVGGADGALSATAPAGAQRAQGGGAVQKRRGSAAAAAASSWQPNRSQAKGVLTSPAASPRSIGGSGPADGDQSARSSPSAGGSPSPPPPPPLPSELPSDAPITAFSNKDKKGGQKAVAELDDDQKIARRKQQRRFKARRILREAIRLSTEEASVAGIDLQGGDFQRLVKIAVEIKKAAAALATSDLLCELGDIQLAMMAAAGKRRTVKRYTDHSTQPVHSQQRR